MSRKEQRDQKEAAKASSEAGGESKEAPQPNALAEWLRAGAWAVVLFLVIRTFLLQTFVIISGSMEETLQVGDYLVVNRAAIGSRVPFTSLQIPGYSSPQFQDVLVFDPPHENFMLVKRLIGMPGDTLEMRDRVLYLNGEALVEPYIVHSGAPDLYHPEMDWQLGYLPAGTNISEYRPTRDTWGPIILPEDRYFMLGDNRHNSQDSRYWGLLEGWRLEGRVSFIYYSYDSEWKRPFAFIRNIRAGRIFDRVR